VHEAGLLCIRLVGVHRVVRRRVEPRVRVHDASAAIRSTMCAISSSLSVIDDGR
jgi:hypothetical protein